MAPKLTSDLIDFVASDTSVRLRITIQGCQQCGHLYESLWSPDPTNRSERNMLVQSFKNNLKYHHCIYLRHYNEIFIFY